MPKWTDSELDILRQCVYDGMNIEQISKIITNHTPVAIRATIDKYDMNFEKAYGRVTVKAVQEYIDKLNANNGLTMPVERGYIGMLRHEDGYSIIQYIDDKMDYCVWGSHLTLIGCYKVLRDYENNCVIK